MNLLMITDGLLQLGLVVLTIASIVFMVLWLEARKLWMHERTERLAEIANKGELLEVIRVERNKVTDGFLQRSKILRERDGLEERNKELLNTIKVKEDRISNLRNINKRTAEEIEPVAKPEIKRRSRKPKSE